LESRFQFYFISITETESEDDLYKSKLELVIYCWWK